MKGGGGKKKEDEKESMIMGGGEGRGDRRMGLRKSEGRAGREMWGRKLGKILVESKPKGGNNL